MKRLGFLTLFITCVLVSNYSFGQIDLSNLDLRDLIGKVVHVEKGFSPKFSLGNTPIKKIAKVAEILDMKKNSDVHRLFNTFRTGRTIYQVGVYAGGAIAVYSFAKKLDNTVKTQDANGALVAGISAIGSGVIVKLLTKGASYKAVDIFNDIAIKKVIDIFSVAPASSTVGVGLYVKL